MSTKLLTPRQRKWELDKLLRVRQEAIKQSVNALEHGKDSIAQGVVSYIKENNVLVEELMNEGRHSLSVTARIKELLKKQREYTSAFAMAIKARSVKQARTVMNWLLNISSELDALA